MQDYSTNYLRAGGSGTLSDYYTANYGHAIFRSSLKKNVVFSQHNLVSDAPFNEFNVILCRNVMLYFSIPLRRQVFDTLASAIRPGGLLALGAGETVIGQTEHFAPSDEYRGFYKAMESCAPAGARWVTRPWTRSARVTTAARCRTGCRGSAAARCR